MHMRQGRIGLRTRLLACGALGAIVTACALAAPAMAQNTADTTAATDGTTTVVVTGIRKGIQDAISAKKKSSQIVEAVSAEDIGKLPDNSIAESIARLPGIAAQRTNGRASTLSVRGLGPDYTLTTLNGREQVSTNDNRSVEFDQYPSELISQVLVYKTPKADMVAQGLAGTADLQTVRPLAFGKRAFAANVRRETNSEKAAIGGMKNTGDRFSLMYIDQFANKTIGLALGYAHTDSPYQTMKKESWGFPNFDSTHLITGGEKDAVDSSNLTRDGYMGVLEFKPNDQLHMTFDAYHSDFKELQRIARLEYPLYWSSAQLQPGYTLGDGFVTKGVFTGVNTVVENYINQRSAKLDSFGWNTEYKLNDKWSLMADVSESKVTRDDTLIESTGGTGANGSGPKDTISFSQEANGLTDLQGVLNYADFNKVFLTDPGGWGGPIAHRAGYVKVPHVEDEIQAVKLAATRSFDGGIFSGVTFGYNHTEHTKSKKGVEGYLGLKGTSDTAVVPDAYRTGVTDASFLGNTSGMISYDALGLYNSGFFNFAQDYTTASLQKTWSVKEKIDYAYLMANINTTWAGVPVTGNIGVMSEHADQRATSLYTTGSGSPTDLTAVTAGTSYTDILPSLSLNFQVSDNTTVRFGMGTTVARPRMDDMAAGTGYGVTTNGGTPTMFQGNPVYWTGGGGNPQLKPWKAENIDLSVERYFGRKGYISAAVFYKKLDTFIFNNTTLHDYTGVPLPSYCTPTTCSKADANRMGTSSQQTNGQGGHIQGIELTASIPGEMIAPWLDGFGLIASESINSSRINPSGTNPVDIPGLSKQVVNTTLYYEKYGFSARISDRYRGDFLGEVPDYTNSLQNNWVHSESVIDAQIGYAFQSGTLKGLSISLSAQNLTNEPFTLVQGKGQDGHVIRQEKYGSTYLFGINYRY